MAIYDGDIMRPRFVNETLCRSKRVSCLGRAGLYYQVRLIRTTHVKIAVRYIRGAGGGCACQGASPIGAPPDFTFLAQHNTCFRVGENWDYFDIIPAGQIPAALFADHQVHTDGGGAGECQWEEPSFKDWTAEGAAWYSNPLYNQQCWIPSPEAMVKIPVLLASMDIQLEQTNAAARNFYGFFQYARGMNHFFHMRIKTAQASNAFVMMSDPSVAMCAALVADAVAEAASGWRSNTDKYPINFHVREAVEDNFQACTIALTTLTGIGKAIGDTIDGSITATVANQLPCPNRGLYLPWRFMTAAIAMALPAAADYRLSIEHYAK